MVRSPPANLSKSPQKTSRHNIDFKSLIGRCMPANIQEQLKCLNDDRRTTDKMLLDSLFNYFFNNKNWSTTQKKNLGLSDTKLVEQPPPLQKKVYSEKRNPR